MRHPQLVPLKLKGYKLQSGSLAPSNFKGTSCSQPGFITSGACQPMASLCYIQTKFIVSSYIKLPDVTAVADIVF